MDLYSRNILLFAVLVYCCCCEAMEDGLKCSACEAVAAELQRRLDAEQPRAHLDMRHRLDKDGQRYGKIINYKVSEIRAVELMEDLCEAMEEYTVVQHRVEDSSSTDSMTAESSSSTEATSDPAEASAKAQDSEPQQQQQQAAWVKFKGEGSVPVAKNQRPTKAEEELRIKQLKTFCGRLLEENEEEVVEALMADQFASGVAPVLCQQITKRCQGKEYEPLDKDLPGSQQQEL